VIGWGGRLGSVRWVGWIGWVVTEGTGRDGLIGRKVMIAGRYHGGGT